MLVDSDFIYYEDAKQSKRKGSIDISTVTELKVSNVFFCSLVLVYSKYSVLTLNRVCG